ncbi:MAG: MATE family efflux transporter [Xanthomonadales bacterium]|nr:MATE family efflux transporter [Xanthomonadales bacterium]NIX14019.1 MATE family efflux transporter [Xanthomonadales bacterium]
MAKAKLQDLTTGPVGGHLRRQATPFALGLVAIFSFEAVDLFFISRLGDAPLAAVSFTFPVIWLIYGIGIGFEAGAASTVSRAVGRKDRRQAMRLTTDTAILASGVLLILGLVGLASIDPVFTLLGATPELLPLIRDYMEIWYWVAPMDAALWCSLAAMRARGNTLLESKIITAAALLNMALDPIFIFGLFGFPRLEIQGAALATVTSTGVMLAFTLLYLNGRLRVYASPIAPIRDILASWKHMLHIGVPAIATNAIIPVSSAIVVSMIAVYGVDAVAGFGVAMRIEPMFLIPFYALSAVSSPFFGQNFGARHFDRLYEARRAITRFCLVFGLGLALVLAVVARPLTGLFSETAAIQEVAVRYLWLVPWSYGAYGLVMSVNASFNGMGQPAPGVVISTMRVIVVFLPLAFLGRWWFDLPGLFGAALASNLALGLLAWVWLGRAIRTGER